MKIKLPHKGGRLSVPAVKVRKNEIPLFHPKADLALGFWVDLDTLLLMPIKKGIEVHYVGLKMLQLPINFHSTTWWEVSYALMLTVAKLSEVLFQIWELYLWVLGKLFFPLPLTFLVSGTYLGSTYFCFNWSVCLQSRENVEATGRGRKKQIKRAHLWHYPEKEIMGRKERERGKEKKKSSISKFYN